MFFRKRIRNLLMASLIVGLFSSTFLHAQSKKTQSKPATASQDGKSNRIIYLPYKDLKIMFDREKSTVFMPYADYLKLLELSSEKTTRMANHEIDAVITESHYKAKIEKEFATITANYKIKVMGKPWVQVPIDLGNAAVAKLTSKDSKAILQGRGKGKYAVLLDRKGEHEFTLEFTTRVHTSPDGKEIKFQCPTVGITTFEITVPQIDQTVNVSPSLVGLPVTQDKKETRVKFGVGSTNQITARWFPRAGKKPQMELLSRVSNRTRVRIQDGLVYTDTELNYEILRGETSAVTVAIPNAHRILDVEGPAGLLKSWKVEKKPTSQLIRVELLRPLKDSLPLKIHTEQPIPKDVFGIAGVDADGNYRGIHAVNAGRESGVLAVSHRQDLVLTYEDHPGWVRVDSLEVPAALRASRTSYFKFFTARTPLRLRSEDVKPSINVNQTVEVNLKEDEITLTSGLDYEIARTGIFNLRIHIPKGLTVNNVNAPNMKEYSIEKTGNTSQLLITFLRKTLGKVTVVVFGSRKEPLLGKKEEFDVPILEPQGVDRSTGRIVLSAIPSLEVLTNERKSVGLVPDSSRSFHATSGSRLVSIGAYTQFPVKLTVSTSQKVSRVTATVATDVNLEPQMTQVVTLLNYFVEHAGVDTFRFAVPKSVSEKMTIETISSSDANNIKQKSPSSANKQGWVTWTVSLQKKVTGNVGFRISYDTPKNQKMTLKKKTKVEPDEEESGGEDLRLLKILRVLDSVAAAENKPAIVVSKVEGEIGIRRNDTLSVKVDASGGDVERIDVRELTLLARNFTDSYRYRKQPISLSLSVEKHEVREVVKTVISKAGVEILVGKDPKQPLIYRCRYSILSSERQRLRLDLPKAALPMKVFVNGKRINLENSTEQAGEGWKSYYLNVSRSGNAEKPFSVALLFRQPTSEEMFTGTMGRVKFFFPKFGEQDDGSSVTQQMKSVIWLPRKYVLAGIPENFVRETKTELTGIFPSQFRGESSANIDRWIPVPSTDRMDFPTQGHAYIFSNTGGASEIVVGFADMRFASWTLGIPLLLIAGVLLRTGWENKLTLIFLTLFLLCDVAFYYSDWVYHGLIAARYGIFLLAVWWAMHGLFSLGKTSKKLPLQTAAVGVAQVSQQDSAALTKTRKEPSSEKTDEKQDEKINEKPDEKKTDDDKSSSK